MLHDALQKAEKGNIKTDGKEKGKANLDEDVMRSNIEIGDNLQKNRCKSVNENENNKVKNNKYEYENEIKN